MSDTLFKRIQILKMIPTFPARVSASEIYERLSKEGFKLTKRTIQRDLKDLKEKFDITNDGNKDIPGWFWEKDAKKIELPEMLPSVALTFRMVKEHLKKQMPPSVIEELSDYFNNADKLLNGLKNNSLSDWSNKVEVISRTQPLLSPKIDSELLNNIYTGLLTETQIKVHYQPRLKEPRDYTINPLGIVVVDQVIYLVGSLWEYRDVNQFALHRFLKVENTEQPNSIPSDSFSLQDYVKNQNSFFYPVENVEKSITLKLNTSQYIAKHLEESPLSTDQTIHKIEDSNRYEVTATVNNTEQLRWWLRGFSSGIEVVEPTELRQEFYENAKKLIEQYAN